MDQILLSWFTPYTVFHYPFINNFSSHGWLLFTSIISLRFAKWWFFYYLFCHENKAKRKEEKCSRNGVCAVFLVFAISFILYHQICEDWAGKSSSLGEAEGGTFTQVNKFCPCHNKYYNCGHKERSGKFFLGVRSS